MGAAALSLAANEVPIGGGRAALAGGDEIAVHADAHRAARLAPLETGITEDAVEAFGFGRELHLRRARYDERRHHRLAALCDLGGGAQVLDSGVGAGADEHLVDLDVGERHPWGEAHV